MKKNRNISTKLFSQLRANFGDDIQKSFKVKTFKKGDFIYREGQTPRGVYFMKYGWVKIFKLDEAYNEVVLHILGNNEFIGYLPLLKKTTYSNNAQALEYCELYFIPKEGFLSLLHESNEFAQLIIQMLCDEIWKDEDQILNLHSKKIDKRLSTLLLGLEQASENDKSYADSHIRLPKKDLAKIINISAETLSRYLTRFQDSGLIESVDGIIKVLKKDELHEMSNLKERE